ncbi:hypothetical protein RQP46_005349 [Phenoliferia psychrophenolica]
MLAMFSLENATPFIYSNVGLFGAFVCSPLAFATALSVEVLSLAFTGGSAFSQEKQQLAKTEPAPAPHRTAPALIPIVSASVEPSSTVVAAARGIDAATASKSPNSGSSSTGDLILVDGDRQDKDIDELSARFAKLGSGFVLLVLAWKLADGEVVFVCQLRQLERVVGQFVKCLSGFSLYPTLPTVSKPVSRPDLSNSSKALEPHISPPVLNAVSASASASVAKKAAKPKFAPTNPTPKPSSNAKVAVVAPTPKTSSRLRTSSPTTSRTSSPLTSPPPPQKSKPAPSSRTSHLAVRSGVPSPTQPSVSRTRDTPLPPSPAIARPVASPSAAKPSSSPVPSPPTAKYSPTLKFSSSIAPAPTPELTPSPTPKRHPASTFSAPSLSPLPLRHEQVKPATPSPTTASPSTPLPFAFKPFADLSVALPPRSPSSPTSSTTSSIPTPAFPIPKTTSLLPALPIASSTAASDTLKLEGLESSRWAYKGYEEELDARVRAEKEKNAPADAAYGAEQITYHDELMSSPLGAVVTPPTPPAHMGDKSVWDNFIEKEGSGPSSNPPAVAAKSAKLVEDSSDDDSDEESVEDNTPRIIRPLRRGRLVVVPGPQSSPLATPVAIAPFAPALAVFPSQQTGYSPMSFDFGSTPVAETTMVDDPSMNNHSSGVDQYSPEAFMDAQPESSFPTRSYLDSSYDYSSYPPSTSFCSFPVDSPFDGYPTTPLANLYSTAGFASFASSSPPSFSQLSSSTPSFYPITPPVHCSLFGEDAEIFDKVAPYYTSTTSTLPHPPPIPTPIPSTPSASSAPRAYNEPLPFPAAAATAGPSTSTAGASTSTPKSEFEDMLDRLEAEDEEEAKRAKKVSRFMDARSMARKVGDLDLGVF